MKKKEILKLIEDNKIIEDNKNILSLMDNSNRINIPKIDDLKNEFNVLESEINEAKQKTDECNKKIKESNCKHEVRLFYGGVFTSNSCCVLCGKSIHGDNVTNWEYPKNRNKHCAILYSKYQYDYDYEEYVEKTHGYTNDQVIKIISNIIENKSNEEEIDLVQEFKKLNLDDCNINEEENILENYIMIIGGSNKELINNKYYVSHNNSLNRIELFKYFSGILNTKVEIIDNDDMIENYKRQDEFIKHDNNLKLSKYSTIKELEKIIQTQKDIPFKIIIDTSNLFEYKIENNSLKQTKYNLDLNKLFPNSHIIKICDMSKKSLEELSNFLKNTKLSNKLYAYNSNEYYSINKNNIEKTNLEETCNHIKKMIKNNK